MVDQGRVRTGRISIITRWMHKAPFFTRDQFKREVDQHLTVGEEEEGCRTDRGHPAEVLLKSDSVIERAIETAALMLGTDDRGYCLEQSARISWRGQPGQRSTERAFVLDGTVFQFLANSGRRLSEQITEKAS